MALCHHPSWGIKLGIDLDLMNQLVTELEAQAGASQLDWSRDDSRAHTLLSSGLLVILALAAEGPVRPALPAGLLATQGECLARGDGTGDQSIGSQILMSRAREHVGLVPLAKEE